MEIGYHDRSGKSCPRRGMEAQTMTRASQLSISLKVLDLIRSQVKEQCPTDSQATVSLVDAQTSKDRHE